MIKRLNDYSPAKKREIISEVREIFFLSTSKKEFESDKHRDHFFKIWCGDYVDHFEDQFFIFEDENQNVGGYLSACFDSQKAMNKLNVPKYDVFSDLFSSFPAHLHINFHPRMRGLGCGSVLVGYVEKVLIQNNILGFHLVTSPDAKNVSFYKRLGFEEIIDRKIGDYTLRFMGKKLTI